MRYGTKRQILWTLGSLITATAMFCAVIGFAHTEPGRPLLPYLTFILGAPKSCPLGFDQSPTTASFRANANKYLEAHARMIDAPVKLVPDFTFGQTTSEQLKSVVVGRDGACTKFKSATELECLNVKTKFGAQSMWVRFNDRDRLANVRGVETIDDVNAAAIRYSQLTKSLDENVGVATQRTGSGAARDLKSGLLYQATSIYTFRNYSAVVRVTNMGKNFAVTTEFNAPEVLTQ